MSRRSDILENNKLKKSGDAALPSNLNSAAQTNEIPNRGGKECDELVKYMSKLPAYLQGQEALQSNVLNVGVLDWGRLEKWNHGRPIGALCSAYCVSSTSTTRRSGGTLPNASHLHMCKLDCDVDKVHTCSNLRKVKASRDLQHSAVHGVGCTLKPELASRDKQEMATCSYKFSARDQERVNNPGKSRRSREVPASSLSEMGNSWGSLGAKETTKRAEAAAGSCKQFAEKLDGDLKAVGGLTCSKNQVNNIVLLPSRKHSRSTLSGVPHMSLDDDLSVTTEVNPALSDRFNCSFDSEDMMLPLSGKKERFGETASRIFDGEDEKKRHPSPSKRFSFSFGRLSRSFTFKEQGSSALTSSDDTIKSDSMRFDGPSQSSNQEKQSVHSGSRVSPLRRLLLKSKGSENVVPSKARSNMDIPLQDEKKKEDATRTRALLQITIRKGIPLFQFVVDDNNNSRRSILGASMKTSASSSVQYCTFYSVNQVKKKKRGSWLIHGHKEKQHSGFVYKVMGEMRLCNSMKSDITEQKSENMSCVIRESVLFDESEEEKGRKEVAAVVIKKKAVEENLGEATVIIPGGVHSIPAPPTPLISRWRYGVGLCDCGGWDVGCKLHVLSNKTFIHELDQSFKLLDQEENDKNSCPVLAMTELKRGMYRVEFGSFLSHLQAFFVCVTVIMCVSEEETVSKATGKSSSQFAPPLSPAGRA